MMIIKQNRILNECVKKTLEKFLNENLYTHDEDYNIYEKLDELDIDYDFINDWETIIEITTPDENTKKKVIQLLNYYGWKDIKHTNHSICAEKIYGENWNHFDDKLADEDDEDYPHGPGIYYHITPTKKVEKILKQGLTVREGNKLGYARGERTYLISYPARPLAHQLAAHTTDGDSSMTILLVDIRRFLGKQINLYHDDFTHDEGAVYTYDYIPPQCITIYDKIEI